MAMLVSAWLVLIGVFMSSQPGTAVWNYGRPIVMVGSAFVPILLVNLGRKAGTLKPITASRNNLIVWGAVVGLVLISGAVVPLLLLR